MKNQIRHSTSHLKTLQHKYDKIVNLSQGVAMGIRVATPHGDLYVVAVENCAYVSYL
jgi:hypothetical protein